MLFRKSTAQSENNFDLTGDQYHRLAFEKLLHMQKSAKESLIPAFMGPLLCIPLFAKSAGYFYFYCWFGIAIICLSIRAFLILSMNLDADVKQNIRKINWAIGLASLCWGLGWLLLLPNSSLEDYLLYYTITLIFIFINMFGNCVNWSTLLSFILPVQSCLFIYYFFIPNAITHWPIVIGASLFFLFSIKLGLTFHASWEKNIILRFRNESLLEELTIEKDASVAANIAKSDFIATASHDLRQPMQAINIFLAFIDDPHIRDVDRTEYIKKLKISADHLNKMFSTLLDISKLDSQSVLLKENYFEISALVSSLQDILQPIAIQKLLELRFEFEDMRIFGDIALLQQALVNLIANGLQYTQIGGVVVEFQSQDGKLLVTISDTGCGISEEELSYVYKEFYRVQSTRVMHDGLGLGLSIVKKIAQLIGADLSVESEVGLGTVFTFKTQFPIVQIYGAKQCTVESKQLIDSGNAVVSQESIFNNLHMAIIEDDEILLDAYLQFFKETGFNVYPISLNETELKNQLMGFPRLDFILSDYRLGKLTGVEYIQKIREEFNEDIPAIIVTADTSPQHINIFDNLNIETLHKPIEPSAILEHIAKYFQNQNVSV